MGFIFQTSGRDNEFVTHYRTKLGTRRADTSYRRRPLMTRRVTDIHAAAVRSLRGSTVANKSEKTIRAYQSRGQAGAEGKEEGVGRGERIMMRRRQRHVEK